VFIGHDQVQFRCQTGGCPKYLEPVIVLLDRLPLKPAALPDSVEDIPRQYFDIEDHSENKDQAADLSLAWEDLKVVSFLTTDTIRAVLLSIIYNNVGELQGAINFLAEILDMASEMSQYNVTEVERSSWVVVRAFL
jgi:hypothetical protein